MDSTWDRSDQAVQRTGSRYHGSNVNVGRNERIASGMKPYAVSRPAAQLRS